MCAGVNPYLDTVYDRLCLRANRGQRQAEQEGDGDDAQNVHVHCSFRDVVRKNASEDSEEGVQSRYRLPRVSLSLQSTPATDSSSQSRPGVRPLKWCQIW